MKKYIWTVLVLCILAACQQPAIFENYKTIEKESWLINDTVRFQVDIPRSGEYDFNVGIRHTTDYEMANLWCFIQIKDSAQTILRDTLNIKIAEPDGRWLGKGKSIKTLETPSHIHMLNAGKYTFDIIQGMRTRSLNGIKNVGLVIRTKETNH